jgi:hypothetical protein
MLGTPSPHLSLTDTKVTLHVWLTGLIELLLTHPSEVLRGDSSEHRARLMVIWKGAEEFKEEWLGAIL